MDYFFFVLCVIGKPSYLKVSYYLATSESIRNTKIRAEEIKNGEIIEIEEEIEEEASQKSDEIGIIRLLTRLFFNFFFNFFLDFDNSTIFYFFRVYFGISDGF